MRVEVALVADDLTGALDAAAPFAARGLRVRVYRTVEALAAAPGAVGAAPPTGGAAFPTPGTPPDPMSADPFPERRRGLDAHDGGDRGDGWVLAVNTSTRHLAPEAARAAVASAARRLLAWSPRIVFKKIDSTLRGPAADEAAAAMEVFGRRSALVCPAFPAAGRVVRGGEVFVYGAPLRETEYVRDLRTPAPAEPLTAMFDRIGGRVRGLRSEDPLPDRPFAGVVIADAETEARLARLAAFVRAHPKEVLAVGSDGLAAGLASLLGRAAPPVRLTGGEGRVLLFALGSRAGTTEEQLARLREANPGLPVVDAPAGALDPGAVVRAAGSARAIVARVPASPRGEPGAVARSFASGVRSAIEGLGGPGRLAALAATGGDTVEAILDAFDVPALDVLGELRPGIPVSRAACPGGGRLTLVSKAGGFGAPDLFAEIAAETAARQGTT